LGVDDLFNWLWAKWTTGFTPRTYGRGTPRPYMNNRKALTMKIDSGSLSSIAQTFGTPTYVYAHQTLEQAFLQLKTALGQQKHQICYAVKANSNLTILKILASLGAGFDIVSQGELEKVLLAGGEPKKIVFSGVGKTLSEIERALRVEIACFNVESLAELDRIHTLAQHLNVKAPIAIRLNPNISVKTHPYMTTGLLENKFGLDEKAAAEAYAKASKLPNIEIKGIACHIGSQITSLAPFLAAADELLAWANRLSKQGIPLQHIDMGGGLGVSYQGEITPSLVEYGHALAQKMAHTPYTLFLEPGRSLIAEAGLLLTRCEYIKTTQMKQFAIVDAGMNDLLRPTLYQAWHPVVAVDPPPASATPCRYDVVGPLCETGDFLALARDFPHPLAPGMLLTILKAGAYGFAMSNQYNSRPRAAEVLVKDGKATLIRRRETWEDLWAKEL
jgi:diaminopimelate decarboxylase